MKPTLVILAAGMGSRYGGLKQMDAFGPSGEAIIEYSIYDAMKAGFGKIVFVVREFFKDDFEKLFSNKLNGKIDISFVTQEIENIPFDFAVPTDRKKPWGTAHAVYMAKDEVEGPFVVINADDFYGRESYQSVKDYFDINTENYSLVGYFLDNTLSEHGMVNRGICTADEDGHLLTVTERTKIKKDPDNIVRYNEEDGSTGELAIDTLVSMNMWGFGLNYFTYFEENFKIFLDNHGQELTSEYYIPTLIDDLIKQNKEQVKVLTCDADWFGVTYKEDKPFVQERLNALIEDGTYPKDLWK